MGDTDSNCYFNAFKQQISTSTIWQLGLPAYKGNYMILDQTHNGAGDNYIQLLWGK